jgi:hypothetical protein
MTGIVELSSRHHALQLGNASELRHAHISAGSMCTYLYYLSMPRSFALRTVH